MYLRKELHKFIKIQTLFLLIKHSNIFKNDQPRQLLYMAVTLNMVFIKKFVSITANIPSE